MNEQNGAKAREMRVAEDLWLSYFNRYLFEHGVITEQERNKMVSKIAERKRRAQTPKSMNPKQ